MMKIWCLVLVMAVSGCTVEHYITVIPETTTKQPTDNQEQCVDDKYEGMGPEFIRVSKMLERENEILRVNYLEELDWFYKRCFIWLGRIDEQDPTQAEAVREIANAFHALPECPESLQHTMIGGVPLTDAVRNLKAEIEELSGRWKPGTVISIDEFVAKFRQFDSVLGR